MFSAIRLAGRRTVGQVRMYASDAPAAAGTVKLTFGSPSEGFYHDVVVDQVNVPSQEGDMGILGNHVPTLAVLRPGVVSVYEQGQATPKQFFVSSGTITINEGSGVQVIAEEAVKLDALDLSKAQQGLAEAQKEVLSAKSDVEKAEADIAYDTYRSMVAALQ
ncbi:ATP synthase F1, epsilon subunit [Sphaeroforma arctica JP610]|uniref:ATP synthase F1, epsilon subunit n=1 Tax=Sphaeroforma arctica JP610 TaxID=667725 RepID=A0A0L0G1K2_9EUKA|nr:ATP synthase F1, epsilon subunit [Sphaeroforma arctica JP610]KNC82714.1 ATP synthase F1, epsilon subunit [Sphaeroforma arctica JP610]|eukprot:XP_014156616.1 ATP synthase F1, epsilon subunit [Sphaeroforma arctica JP610]